MEEVILISYLNDYIFCPASIYFHRLYGNLEGMLYKRKDQINGSAAHIAVDNKKYSTRKDVLQGIDVFCKEFNIIGKIDVFDIKTGVLTERKNKIQQIYDGYIYQVYAQYYALIEMGYEVSKIRLHSIIDNKNYDIKLPTEDVKMDNSFRMLLHSINEFDISQFKQSNIKKCEGCIYEPSCDRSLI